MQQSQCLWAALAWLGLTATPADAAEAGSPGGPPAYFAEPARVAINAQSAVYETYGEAEFVLADGTEPAVKQGHHYHFDMKVKDLADGTPFQTTWTVLWPSLASRGWKTVFAGNGFFTIRYQKEGKDVFGVVGIFGPDDIRVDLVDICPPPAGFVVPAPAPKAEPSAAAGLDFPLVPPLPGSRRAGSDHFTDPMLISLPGDEVPEVVSTGSTTKNYEGPPTLSNLETITRYQGALSAAGWTIAEKIQGVHNSDGVLIAHYARGERNLWLALHSAGSSYSLQLSDEAPADQFAAALQKSCHAILTGVLFDFNKATLKPDSDAVLQRVAALATRTPDLRLEVQGHTDNVGSDEYNLTLSRARAMAVRDWLVAHGIATARLTANGYGKTRPIASNDDDVGRAKNRRVEIARPNCTH